MSDGWLPSLVVGNYLTATLVLGLLAGRCGTGDATDFVAGECSSGPLVMYLLLGATVFSAFALLGVPQQVMARGTGIAYLLAFGSEGFAPLFFFGAKLRRIGARGS